MRARARLVAAPGRVGQPCRLLELRSDPPFTLRPTGPGSVHLVASAAGPLGGDDLVLEVVVLPGASLTVRSTAATLVLPAPVPTPSRLEVVAEVHEGAALDWGPEPTILAGRVRHRGLTRLTLAADARVRWREDVVVGRQNGEEPDHALLATRVDRDGRALVRHELVLGRDVPGASGPAVLGSARWTSTVLVTGPDAEGADTASADHVDVAVADGARWSMAVGGRDQVPGPGPAEACREGLVAPPLPEPASDLRA